MNPTKTHTKLSNSDELAHTYRRLKSSHSDQKAVYAHRISWFNRYYHGRISSVYRSIIPEQSRVLELGCATGRLLHSLNPSRGVGVDFSEKMIDDANVRYPELNFIQADAHDLELEETFDFVIFSDLINDLWDMQGVLERLHKVCHGRTRIIFNNYSRLWELPLWLINKFGLGNPKIQRNWLASKDINNFLDLAGYETIRVWDEILLPVKIPILTNTLNRFVVKLWPFNHLALTKFVIARPSARHLRRVETEPEVKPLVTIVVPARNESGHIPILFNRLPKFDHPTELVFVEGNSTDDTSLTIKQEIENNSHIQSRLYIQNGIGKKDAVELGIKKAKGSIVVILDADLTVAPEDLPRFVSTITSGRGEFINGVRMVYPLENGAMRKINLLGNKFFALSLSWVMGQRVGDSLCGTKVFRKADYEYFSNLPNFLGHRDPFGDFSLLLGAASMNLKIIDVPVRYRARRYGETNIRRWRDGAKLMLLLLRGATQIRFK